MGSVFLAAVGVDDAFHRDFSTNTVFTTAVSGGKAAQTTFRTRSAAGADTLVSSEGGGIGEPADSSPPTPPQATDLIRQYTVVVLVASHATP